MSLNIFKNAAAVFAVAALPVLSACGTQPKQAERPQPHWPVFSPSGNSMTFNTNRKPNMAKYVIYSGGKAVQEGVAVSHGVDPIVYHPSGAKDLFVIRDVCQNLAEVPVMNPNLKTKFSEGFPVFTVIPYQERPDCPAPK